MSNTRRVKLHECAEVLSGYSTKGAVTDDLNGTVQVIMAKHISGSNPYVYREDHRLRIEPNRSVDKYLLKRSDILFMSRGTGNYAVLLADFPEPAIAPSTFYIIKAKDQVLPGYLAWCLNQQFIQLRLNEIRTGAGTPLIPRQEFAEIDIPLPSLDKQQKIAQLAQLQQKEAELRKKLIEETELFHKLLGQKILDN